VWSSCWHKYVIHKIRAYFLTYKGLYPASDAPLYTSGMSICAGAMVFVAFLALVLRLYLNRINRKATQGYGKIWDEGHSLVPKEGGAAPFKLML